MKTALALLALASTASAEPLPAHADVVRVRELVPTCVAIDADHDALSAEDRVGAVRTLARVLEQAELLVVETGCVDTYTLRHERSPEGLVVHVRGPRGARRLHAKEVAALGATYREAVYSLFATSASPAALPPPVAETNEPAMPRVAQTSEPAAPATTDTPTDPSARVPAAGGLLWYGALGIAPVAHADAATSFGGGLREEHAGVLIDIGFDVLSSGDGSRSVRADRFGARVVRVLRPDAAASPYIGAGLALGSTRIEGQYAMASGSGLEATAVFGFDLVRDHRGARLFTELAVVAPFYELSDATWTPSALLRVGVGK